MRDKSLSRPRRFPPWETAAIFAALASLWPAYILNLDSPVWRPLCYAMLGLMAVILVRRLIAFERLKDEAEKAKRAKDGASAKQQTRLPWEPPGDDV